MSRVLFYEKRPELLAEWDDENTVASDIITAASNKKVWWKGSCGHRWEARVADRVAGSDCPYCAGKLLPGFNDLATTNPELLEEWSERNEKTPQEFLPKSIELVWWKCRVCGTEWKARIRTKVSGTKCPECRHRESIRKYEKAIEKRNERRRAKKERVLTVLKKELEKRQIPFVEDDTETIGVPLSFFVPDYLLAVECSDMTHKTLQWRRKALVKNELCLKARIRVIWILATGIDPFPNCRCINLTDDTDEAVYEAVQALIDMIFD